MKNLKIQIKIEDNDNLKEAHDLLLKLGFSTYNEESFGVWDNCPKPIWLKTNCFDNNPNKIDWVDSGDYKPLKEITLPQLRDLVVLKRNDVGDKTHYCDSTNSDYFISSRNTVYFFDDEETHTWKTSNYRPSELKPIEKPMKEYLNKETYAYVKTHDLVSKDSNWIEIPEGAEIYIDLGFRNHSFYKDNFKLCWCGVRWENTVHNSMNLEHWNNTPVLWKRHTNPEELPFIDDEPSLGNSKIGRRAITVKIPVESLNDQYAEIETVRQSAWQKQEGGSHYKNLKIQPMQYALENKLDYAQANVVKYVTRHKEKNGKEDLLKAIHNIELMIEFYYGDEK